MNIQKGTLRYHYGKREQALSFRPGYSAKGPGMEIISEMIPLDHGWHLKVSLIPDRTIETTGFNLDANYRFTASDKIFCNGFQSWTESREFFPNERMKKLSLSSRRYKVHCFGDYHFFPYTGVKGNLHSHAYCYIKQKTGDLTFLGSLKEETGYTIYSCETKKNHIGIIKDIEGLVISDTHELIDILLLQGPEREVIQAYFDRLCPGLETREPATGWTSWHKYHANISQDIILDNLASLKQHDIPIDFFNIDDGYQLAVGDWLEIKQEFPDGMKPVADKIRASGFKAGLWVAPFVCEEKSDIMNNHPDWLLKKDGKPVPAGSNPLWNGTFYALDIYNDEFRYHMKEVLDTILNQWGFDMVKLDYLYAAAMIPRDGKTRGTIMADGMKFLRRCVGEKLMLGGGVPLGSAFGMTDYCRIGSDASPRWEDRLQAAIGNRERASTSNSIASAIGRSHMNGRVFANDPDGVILRDEDNALSQEQRYTHFLLNNILGGVLFNSDIISAYSSEIMRLYRSLFPFRKKEDIKIAVDGVVKITFRIGDNSYLVYSNPSNRREKALLDEGFFFCSSLDEDSRFTPGGEEISLKAYESRCYLAVKDAFFTVSGTTAHLFPGSEIVSCVQKGDIITISQHEYANGGNTVYIRTPSTGQFLINGKTVQARKIREKLFILAGEL
jgi:alpha-galactosidase